MKIKLPHLTQLLVALCLLISINVSAQKSSRTISGRISDANNAAIPGVTIYQKGTSNGTSSDADGKYSLTVFDSATLVFSFIGYATQEIQVGASNEVNVVLQEDSKLLDEVVAVGYGEQKRSNVSGALSVVKVGDMQNKTQFRLDDALQGMAAGVNVTRSGGAPGAAPTVHIRGVGSIGATDPLWIIDGIKMDPGNNFDMNDVESIEILKDAAASAVYGAQAAHGVILVKTKRGKGDFQVTFKSSVGQRSPVKLPHLLGSADYIKYKKESRLNAGQNPDPSWDSYNADTDWIKNYFAGSGIIQSYNLSISKGDEKFNFYASFGHDNEQGILIDNSYKRYSMRVNADMKLTKWMKLGESVLLSRVVENPISNIDVDNTTGGVPYRSTPVMPIHDPTNPYGGWGTAPVYFQGTNPVAAQYQQHEARNSNRVNGNIYLELTPLKGLMVRSSVGLNYLSMFDNQFTEAYYYGPGFTSPLNQLTYSAQTEQTLVGNIVGTYDKSFGKHNFKIMAGTEAMPYETTHFNVVGNDFPVDVSWSMNLRNGALSTTDLYNVLQQKLFSEFGRANYTYADKYIVEFNIRRDGSSKFGPLKRFGIFPSYSVAWNITNENFFRFFPSAISSLKLRASSGKLGSNNIPDYIFSKTYTSQFSTYAFDDLATTKVHGYYLSRFPNGDVHWEEVNMKNVALDMTMFSNKLRFSVDYYVKDTKDLLYPVPLPASVGISTNNFDAVSPQVNIGTMRNIGIDFEVGYNAQLNEKFSLNTSGNVSFLKNKMLSLYGSQFITGGSGGQQIGGMTRTEPGHPVSSFYGYKVQQMLNSASDVYAVNTYSADGVYQQAATGPGDFMYRDLNGPSGTPDGKITPEYDRTYIGNPWPKMLYALNLNATYNKMFDLSLQFQGVYGVDIFNASKAYMRNFFGDYNSTNLIAQAWTPEHHTNNPRNISTDPNSNWGNPSTYFIENGSYLKLRNIQVGFTMPRDFLNRAKIKKLRLYVNVNNALTFTKYSGLDPEVAGTNTSRGVDFGIYPQVRTYSGGLEIQF